MCCLLLYFILTSDLHDIGVAFCSQWTIIEKFMKSYNFKQLQKTKIKTVRVKSEKLLDSNYYGQYEYVFHCLILNSLFDVVTCVMQMKFVFGYI